MNGFNKLDSRSEARRSAETIYPFIGRGDRGKLRIAQGGPPRCIVGVAFALLFFAGLFTLIAWLQYWFVKDQLHRTVVTEMDDRADEIIDEIDYKGKWDLTGYRRSNPEAATYYIVTLDGFLVDIAGLISGMIPRVRVPAGLIYDQPFSVISEIGERWRLFAKRVRGGMVILGDRVFDPALSVDSQPAAPRPYVTLTCLRGFGPLAGGAR
jgi:hypothetical protein